MKSLSRVWLLVTPWTTAYQARPSMGFSRQTIRHHSNPSLCSNQRRQWHPTPVLLPGKSHGRRSLVGFSPWGHSESDTTEQLHFHFSLSCTGEGNGNPLQCSCLENPRDGEAWWAAVYGVTQSRTRLKWLSNSNSNRRYQEHHQWRRVMKSHYKKCPRSHGCKLIRVEL